MKKKVLFLCTGNSCRSQMAEGFARALKSEALEACSAGLTPHVVNPTAIRVMRESGVDISAHKSKHIDEVKHLNFDYVITVCDNANEQCPLWSGQGERLHHSFDDPPSLAGEATSEEEVLGIYRRVRDEIRRFVESLPESLSKV